MDLSRLGKPAPSDPKQVKISQWYRKSLCIALQVDVEEEKKDDPIVEQILDERIKKGKFEYPVKYWGIDLQSEHERFLVEKHFKAPVVIYDYPANIKAFYMRLNDDGKTVRAMDVLFPGIGEIAGGSQREERYDILKEKVAAVGIPEEELWWYLETRKFGTCIHSGFGLGFERLVLFDTGMGNIRDVIPFPRTPGSANF